MTKRKKKHIIVSCGPTTAIRISDSRTTSSAAVATITNASPAADT